MIQEEKRFVIQEHTRGADIHWDLMFELNGMLETYRLDRPPDETVQYTANATKIFDHPLKFLTYEGLLNTGRGNVRIVEKGTYRIINQEDDRIELELNGKILKGRFTFTNIEENRWQFSADRPEKLG